jgi:hypothetical protein
MPPLTLTLSHLMGEGTAIACRGLAIGGQTTAVAGSSVRRPMILPLLGGEGRGEVEPLLRALHSAVRLRPGCDFAALCPICPLCPIPVPPANLEPFQ